MPRRSPTRWAVGAFRSTGVGYDDAGLEPFAEHCDGSTWKQFPVVGTRFNDDSLNAVAGTSGADAWAVGSRNRTNFKNPVTTIAYHWNGTAWSETATPLINGTRYSFAGISAWRPTTFGRSGRPRRPRRPPRTPSPSTGKARCGRSWVALTCPPARRRHRLGSAERNHRAHRQRRLGRGTGDRDGERQLPPLPDRR